MKKPRELMKNPAPISMELRGCGRAPLTDAPDGPARTDLRCACGAWLRPDVVWFGEPLDPGTLREAEAAVAGADVVLVVGTSAVVYPVAALPGIARARGARLIEVNPAETALSPYADAVIRRPAAEALPALEAAL